MYLYVSLWLQFLNEPNSNDSHTEFGTHNEDLNRGLHDNGTSECEKVRHLKEWLKDIEKTPSSYVRMQA